jgi:CubicO group peptidase (beta-lactamase class C family)
VEFVVAEECGSGTKPSGRSLLQCAQLTPRDISIMPSSTALDRVAGRSEHSRRTALLANWVSRFIAHRKVDKFDAKYPLRELIRQNTGLRSLKRPLDIRMGCSSAQTKAYMSLTCLVLATLNSLPDSESSLKLAQYMDRQLKTNHFSGAVLIAKNGETLMTKGYGMASVELRVSNAPRTGFRLGPITHQFTAMAILELEKAGKLNVQDSVCKYISECPREWQEIKVVDLLTHTSGIPDLANEENSITLPTTVPELLAGYKNRPLEFKPGENLKYSNVGYDVLSAVIENASGEPYARYLRDHIFKPLGMRDTRSYDRASAGDRDRASGYRRDGGRLVLVDASCSDISSACDDGLYSTVGDLYRWDRALYNEGLLPKESITEMFTPYRDGYGFGWRILKEFQRKVFTYSGKADGFSASIRRYPDDDACVIVLSNLESADAEKITHDLGAILFGVHYELPIAPGAIP